MEKFKSFIKDNWLFVFAIAYLILPVDIVPDIIPVIGKADDTTLLLVDLVKRYLDYKKVNEKN